MSKLSDILDGTVRVIKVDEHPKDIHPVKNPNFTIEESVFEEDSEKCYAIITSDKAYSNEAVLGFIEYKSGLPGWGITPGWQGFGGCYRRADGLYEWKVDRKENE